MRPEHVSQGFVEEVRRRMVGADRRAPRVVDRQFERVHDEFGAVRQEGREIGRELRAETQLLREEMTRRFDSVDRRLERFDGRFDLMLGAMVST